MNEIHSYYGQGQGIGDIDQTYFPDELNFPQERQMTMPTMPYPGQPYPTMPYPAQPYPTQPYHAMPYPTHPYPMHPPYPSGRPPYWYGSGTAMPTMPPGMPRPY
ncbi:hypothetical protein [Sporolactobacillus putidus]|uniref:Uncharacterized protein n=1 Tax=Sporolactobacillus putidus TaxID=492735 RepID=A0A917S9Y9_9BACL|nr:hypothetical protein [Sporolactobacillus putidus]GGL65069.1 hypothetical protein GCM10007968_31300 [Sporolactobacillus putidus]